MIVIDEEYAEAKVYFDFVNQKHLHVYLVKVSFTDIGCHINSITVQPSPKYPDKMWVQMPRFNVKGGWIWPLQIEKSSELRELIERLALEVVEDYSKGKDEVYQPTDEELENPGKYFDDAVDDYSTGQSP